MAPSAPLHGKNHRFAVHTFQLEHQISLDIQKSKRQEDNLDYGGRDLNFAAPITKHATKFVEPAQHQSSMQLDRPNHEWKPREILGKEVVNGSSFHVLNDKRSQKNIDSPEKTIAILKSQISNILQLLLSKKEAFAISKKKVICQLSSCGLTFNQLDHFNKHIRDSSNISHKMLKIILDQLQCTDCNKTFTSSRGLIRHERECHKLLFLSRIDKVLGLRCCKDSAHDKTMPL